MQAVADQLTANAFIQQRCPQPAHIAVVNSGHHVAQMRRHGNAMVESGKCLG